MKLLVVKDDTVYPWVIRIVVALANVAHQAYLDGLGTFFALPFEITSGMDGKHSRRSRHYLLAALDQRSKDMVTDAKHRLVALVQAELGPEYEVILEHEGLDNEHLHIEWDPK